jgi:hypothetical protein
MSTTSAQHALVSNIQHHKQRKAHQSMEKKKSSLFPPRYTIRIFISFPFISSILFITFSNNPPVSHSIHQRISPSEQDRAFQMMKTPQKSVP